MMKARPCLFLAGATVATKGAASEDHRFDEAFRGPVPLDGDRQALNLALHCDGCRVPGQTVSAKADGKALAKIQCPLSFNAN